MSNVFILKSLLIRTICGPDSSPSQEHFVVFLGKTLASHSASLTQVYTVNGYWKIECWGLPCDGLASHPGGSRKSSCSFMLLKLGDEPLCWYAVFFLAIQLGFYCRNVLSVHVIKYYNVWSWLVFHFNHM